MPLPTKIALAPKALRSFAAKVNGLLAWAEPWDRLKVGTGLRFTRADGGHLLSVDAVQMGQVLAAQEGGGSGDHPFKVTLTNPSTPSATISASSYLWTGYTSAGTTQTITDLTTPITLAANTRIYLRITVSSLSISSPSIVTSTSALLNVVTSGSPPAQTQGNVLIGRVQSGALPAGRAGFNFTISGTQYHFEQTLFNHVVAVLANISGTPAYVLHPFSGS